MTDLKQPMTLEDFALVMPLIVTEVVAACSPDSKTADARLISIANNLLEMTYSMDAGREKDFLAAIASQIIATEPD